MVVRMAKNKQNIVIHGAGLHEKLVNSIRQSIECFGLKNGIAIKT